ncbi:hypothetical protein [Peribacillus sp. NPDC096448]|uniref:hypothetical protein n=1 Tax=Peribacillus sp. NPDC096448 TaxID=3364395 RepID=UPI0026F7C97D|nr:hypothetical protein [Peribacillus frigoritolerans]
MIFSNRQLQIFLRRLKKLNAFYLLDFAANPINKRRFCLVEKAAQISLEKKLSDYAENNHLHFD